MQKIQIQVSLHKKVNHYDVACDSARSHKTLLVVADRPPPATAVSAALFIRETAFSSSEGFSVAPLGKVINTSLCGRSAGLG